MDKYEAASRQVYDILVQFDPRCQMMSLDEAKLDLTAHMSKLSVQGRRLEEVLTTTVAQIRERVFEATKLTCSAGIGPTFMVAKIASNLNKPNGQSLVPFDREGLLGFVRPLPTRKVGGIGKVTERVLREVLAVETVGDLYEKRVDVLHVFTPKLSAFLFRVSLAVDEDDEAKAALDWVDEAADSNALSRKGMGCERTFDSTGSLEKMRSKLHELCGELGDNLKAEGLSGQTVTLKASIR